jgi:hypothetical protein
MAYIEMAECLTLVRQVQQNCVLYDSTSADWAGGRGWGGGLTMQFNWTVAMGTEDRCIPYVDDACAYRHRRWVGSHTDRLSLGVAKNGHKDEFVQKLFYPTGSQ